MNARGKVETFPKNSVSVIPDGHSSFAHKISRAAFSPFLDPGTFTPSNLRLRRRLPLLLLLLLRLLDRLLLDLHKRGYSQLPGDQRFVGRGILDVFCSCPI